MQAAQQRLLQLQVADRVFGASIDDDVRLDAAHVAVHQQQSLVHRARRHRQVAVRRAPPVGRADPHPVVAEVDFDPGLLQVIDAEDAVCIGEDVAAQHGHRLVLQHEVAHPQFVDQRHRHDRRAGHAMHLGRCRARRVEAELCGKPRRKHRTVRAKIDDEPVWTRAVDLDRGQHAAHPVGSRGRCIQRLLQHIDTLTGLRRRREPQQGRGREHEQAAERPDHACWRWGLHVYFDLVHRGRFRRRR